MKRTIFKLIAILCFSFICCKYFDYSNNVIINYNFILSSSINILAVTLAITTIFFTVIDRYKDKQNTPKSIETLCFPILKEMCENVFGILFAVVLMVIISIFDSVLVTFTFSEFMGNFSISTFTYLTGFILILTILFDITKSVFDLTKNLFITRSDEALKDDKYIILLDMCQKLDTKHFNELLEYYKTLILKQEIEKEQKKNEKPIFKSERRIP